MLVLLDLDGTLTDPYDGITRSVAFALDELGVPPLTADQLRAFIGPPLHDQLASLGLDATAVERAVAAYRQRFTSTGIFENRVYPGVPDMLAGLADAGHTLAVATSKPTPFAERIVEHFGLADRLALVAGATMDGSVRHKADVIGVALRSLGVGAAEAVMVGDRAHDVWGAQAHGMRTVGVSWGYAEPGELESAGADRVIDHPHELLAAVG